MRISRAKWKWIALGAAAALVIVIIGIRGVARAGYTHDKLLEGDVPLFDVRQGPLDIAVSVSGTISPKDQEILKCEVEGQTTILWIIPEGEHVKEGDLLVELDASRLEDDKTDQEIRVQNAEASYISARESLAVTKNQAESNVDKARLTLRFAEEDLVNYREGEFPKQLKEIEARITLARGTLKRAENELAGSRRLAEQDFITATELEADEQAAIKAKLDLELAIDDKKLLTEYTYKRRLAELESDVRQARMALERVERKASADVIQAEANLKAKESEYNRQQDKLAKILDQIEKTKIYAPTDGLVIYATSADRRGGRGRSTEPLDEGQTVRERQELIYLPTTSSFLAEVDIHESSLSKVSTGLPATITVDALPGRSFRGTVASVAPLPDAQSAWLNPDLKVYNTIINLEEDVTGLRTGMSCRAEILVARYDDALYVPVQTIVRIAGQPTAFVAAGGKAERRPVEIGLDNNRMVHILSGLEAGEQVLLAPPLAAEEQTGADAETEVSEVEGAAASGAPEAPPAPTVQPVAQPDTPAQPDRDAMRERFENASPEEREKMREEWRKRLENMTPEQREQMMKQFQRGRRGKGARDEGGD